MYQQTKKKQKQTRVYMKMMSMSLKYLCQSFSFGNNQSSPDLSWRRIADTNPEQQDSPHCGHDWKTGRPFLGDV